MAGFGRLWPENAIAREAVQAHALRYLLFPTIVRTSQFQDKTPVKGIFWAGDCRGESPALDDSSVAHFEDPVGAVPRGFRVVRNH